jgi:hypothetical protein
MSNYYWQLTIDANQKYISASQRGFNLQHCEASTGRQHFHYFDDGDQINFFVFQ